MSILGLKDVVFDKATGKWVVVDQQPKKSPAEPKHKVPTNLGDDPEAVRGDRAVRKPT